MALRAAEQDRPELVDARAAWRAEPAGIEPRRLVFVDESGIDTCTTRAYARAPRGRRAAGKVPYRHWRRPTVLGALALDGAVGAVSIAAATGARPPRRSPPSGPRSGTGGSSRCRSRPCAPGRTRRGDGRPRRPQGRAAPESAGIACRHLPAHSPDLDPIGPCWSKPKGRLRAEPARGLGTLDAALGPAPATITARDASGWFRLCGHLAPS